jgi:PAS domain S-box-containing protein
MSEKSKRGLAEPGEAAAALHAFSEILEASSRAVVLIELSGAIPYANPRFCELTGYPRAELPRMTIFDLGARPQQEELGMWEAVSAGRMWQGHIPGRRKNGDQFWANAFVAPIVDRSGDIAFYLAAFEETTEPLQQPEFPTDAPPDMVLLAAIDGTILYISQTVPGVSRENVTGDTIFNYVPPDYHERLRQYVDQVIRTKQPVAYEIPSVGPHGTVAWYVTQVGPVQRGGEVVALSFITADLTRRQGRRPPDTSIAAQKRLPSKRRGSPPRSRDTIRASRSAPQPVDLSKRELEVLKLLAQGLTNRQVAGRLRVSLRTIDHHVSHILSKLSVPNRTAAAMAARRTGLLQ